MKKILTILSILYSTAVNATQYYVASAGNDTNNGTSILSPWKTTDKVNASTFAANDIISFKAGETFYGSLTIPRHNLTINTYGSGASANITGFTDVTSWTNVSGNIWESTSAVSSLSTCNIASIAGANYSQGRTPNSGYWNITSTNGISNITNSSLNAGTLNWTGAQVVMRKYRWIMDKYTISSASGSTINFSSSGDQVQANFGFFVMNDQRCLDVANEWSYNSSTKKMSIYKTSSPTNVKVPSIETAINLNGKNYITIDNINFTGFNSFGVNGAGNDHITVINCSFSFIGNAAIYMYQTGTSATYCQIENNSITEIGSMGIHMGYGSNSVVTNNSITQIGRYPGMGQNGDVSYCGIVNVGANQTISNNTLKAIGYCGIRFDGSASVISGNVVDSFCFTKDDGGGIYVYPNATGPSNTVTYSTRTVRENIVINGVGALAGGEGSSNFAEVMCFYNDGTSPDIHYIKNTAINAHFGFFSNSGKRNKLDSNNIYNCTRNIHIVKYDRFGLDNWIITNNRSVSLSTNQYALYVEPGSNSIPTSWYMDFNCYARPMADNTTIWYDPGGSNVYVTLPQWKASAFASGEDQNSTKSFKSIATLADMQVVYNTSSSSYNASIPGVWADIKTGTTFTNTVPLQPKSSMILLKMSNPPLPSRYIIRGYYADGSEFRWQSLEEDNLAYWAVEESSDGGKSWNIIGTKKAVGPSLYILRP